MERNLNAEVATRAQIALKAPGPLVVGFSGGGDSLALLHMLGEIAPERTRIAVIVDHGIRSESANEAAFAAALAREVGATPIVRRLDWPTDASASQNDAREARHIVFAEEARRHGAEVIWLGHTRDDQAETIRMRRIAGSGSAGLAGMAPLSPSPIWPEGRGLWIARPLLTISRLVLRQHLHAERLCWIEDRSNIDPRFTRVRMRAELAGREDLIEEYLGQGRYAAWRTFRLHFDASALVEKLFRIEGGAAVLDPAGLGQSHVWKAISVVATALGGRRREPSREDAQKLIPTLHRGNAAAFAGAVFLPRKRGIAVTRDAGGVQGRRGGGRPHAPITLVEGQPAVWDRRLELIAHEPGWTAVLAPRRRLSDPVFHLHGEPADPGPAVARRWLIEERIRNLLWRAFPPGFR